MSSDTRLFQPPDSYPEAPRDMYYAVPPTKPEPKKMVKVFPWEGRVGRPTRVFPEESSTHEQEQEQEHEQITASSGWQEEKEKENAENSEIQTLASWKSPSPSPPPSVIEREGEEEKPTASFENYTHSNAWDQVPEIQQYIESIQKARETRRRQGTSGTGTPVSLSTPSTPSVAVRGSHLRLGDLALLSRSSSSSLSSSGNNRDKGGEKERDTPTTTTPLTTEPPPDLLQDDWTSLTMDGFVRLLQFIYLYCTFTTTAKAGASSASTG